MRSNKPEEFALAAVIYINTLMLQQVIKESNWLEKMELEDKRAITPLLHEHLNPYGVFLLNLDKRIAVNHPFINQAA